MNDKKQDLCIYRIQNAVETLGVAAVYMRIFISVVQMQRIQNSKKFCILFLFAPKSDILTMS